MIVDLHWYSTPAERYDTDMNERARAHVPQGTLISSEGGSGRDFADNHLFVTVPGAPEALTLARKVADEVRYHITVRRANSGDVIGEADPS
jgi:hypothetical protein